MCARLSQDGGAVIQVMLYDMGEGASQWQNACLVKQTEFQAVSAHKLAKLSSHFHVQSIHDDPASLLVHAD